MRRLRFVLGVLKRKPASRLLDRLHHPQRLAGQIDVNPSQSQDLAAPQSGGERQEDRRIEACGRRRGEQLRGFVLIEDLDLVALDPGGVAILDRVVRDQLELARALQGDVQHPVMVAHRLWAQPAAPSRRPLARARA